MKYHVHKYRFECKYSKSHNHRLIGYAGNMLGIGYLHFHIYYGVSTYDDHTHYFYGITGMPIKTQNGHIHKMDGILESNNMHEHKFEGNTNEDISYHASGQLVSPLFSI